MLKKGTKLYSIIKGYCPKCQNESMYINKNPYKTFNILKMNEKCSHCHLKYQIEPSFFYGSMYVSYAVGVAFAVAAFIVSYFFFKTSTTTAFYSIVATLVVFMPIITRLSRNIWINIFIHFDKTTVDK